MLTVILSAALAIHQGLSGVQVLAGCQTAAMLQAAQDDSGHPRWLARAETPVLIGGFAAVVTAYAISMYTIYHVAKAYKKLEIRVRSLSLRIGACSLCARSMHGYGHMMPSARLHAFPRGCTVGPHARTALPAWHECGSFACTACIGVTAPPG